MWDNFLKTTNNRINSVKVLLTHENTNIGLPFGLFSCCIILYFLRKYYFLSRYILIHQWVHVEIKELKVKSCVDPLWLVAYKLVQLFLTEERRSLMISKFTFSPFLLIFFKIVLQWNLNFIDKSHMICLNNMILSWNYCLWSLDTIYKTLRSSYFTVFYVNLYIYGFLFSIP